jgi:hypothetical protein
MHAGGLQIGELGLKPADFILLFQQAGLQHRLVGEHLLQKLQLFGGAAAGG